MSLLILSPHLDDAALSCTDYLHRHHDIHIVTVFTRFTDRCLPPYTHTYVTKSGFDSVKQFASHRIKEDIRAMKKLNVSYLHLPLVDGGFRTTKGVAHYSTYDDLFSGKISTYDQRLLLALKKFLTSLPPADEVLVPLGIGGHADHVLVRQAAEAVFDRNQLRYYADMPYALHLSNWQPFHTFLRIANTNFSSQGTPFKQEVINCYLSQIDLLLPSRQIPPDIIMRPFTWDYLHSLFHQLTNVVKSIITWMALHAIYTIGIGPTAIVAKLFGHSLLPSKIAAWKKISLPAIKLDKMY